MSTDDDEGEVDAEVEAARGAASSSDGEETVADVSADGSDA
jgi:hypothetical protein